MRIGLGPIPFAESSGFYNQRRNILQEQYPQDKRRDTVRLEKSGDPINPILQPGRIHVRRLINSFCLRRSTLIGGLSHGGVRRPIVHARER